MNRFQFRFWPTAIMLIMMAMLIGLGTWQLQRRVWKTDLLATIAQRMNGDAVALPTAIDDPSGWTFRHVTVSGHFDQSYALWLYGRTHDGKVGVHLLVPLIRDTGDTILVDRGFVPFGHGSELVPFVEPSTSGTVDGIVRTPEPGGMFMPANQPDKNQWYAVDIAQMSKAVGMTLAPVYIAARPVSVQNGGADGWPVATGGTEGTGIRNEHLNYAIFWYSMALVLALIYVMSSRSRPIASKTE
jgi:surfeit locus 1 family protein